MACCNRSFSWECVYPDPCPCCTGCTACVCQYCSDPAHCSSNSSICGSGACGICNSSSWQYAWKTSPCPSSPCPGCQSCNNILYFTKPGVCQVYDTAHRCDTQNQGSATLADLTKALFTQFATLSSGVVNLDVTDNLGCC